MLRGRGATAAPVALAGLGAFVAVRFFLRLPGRAKIAGVIAALVVVGSLGWLFADGLQHRWVSKGGQWANEDVRTSLTAVNVVSTAAGTRPNILVMNFLDGEDSTGTNVAYGWAKTDTNIFRTGISGTADVRSATYLGTLENFLAGKATTSVSGSKGYDTIAKQYSDEVLLREKQYPADPVVFLYGDFYKGNVDVQAALAQGTEIGPNIVVINGSGLYQPPADVVQRAQAAAAVEKASLDNHAGPFGDPLHLLRVLFGLFLLALLPGLVAAPAEGWHGVVAVADHE